MTTFRVYYPVPSVGHQPVQRAGKLVNFRTRETAEREAAKHGPKALVIANREGK